MARRAGPLLLNLCSACGKHHALQMAALQSVAHTQAWQPLHCFSANRQLMSLVFVGTTKHQLIPRKRMGRLSDLGQLDRLLWLSTSSGLCCPPALW